jgi:hypothetical protein
MQKVKWNSSLMLLFVLYNNKYYIAYKYTF